MEKKPTPRQIGVHIKTLRGKRKQGEFARLVDVTQGAISAWERGDKRRVPSADIYFKLGSMARDPMETIFFWKLAGVNQEALLSAANRVKMDTLKERVMESKPLVESGDVVLVPRFRETAKGREEAGPPVPFARQFVPNPISTICVLADERSTGLADCPVGTILLDTSYEGAEDLRPLWEHVVMLKFVPEFPVSQWPIGIYFGRLRLHIDTIVHASEPNAVRVLGYLDLVTGDPYRSLVVGSYSDPEGRKGLASGETGAFSRRLAEIETRAILEFRMREGLRILGKVMGRLSEPIEKGK